MKLRIAVAAVFVSACVTTTTWKFQRVEGEVASIHPELWDEVMCTGVEASSGDGGCAARLAPVVTCETSPGLCQRPPGGGAAMACGTFEPLLTFLQLSDVKLREHAVLVTEETTPELPKALDQLYRTDDAVLLATVLGANQLGTSGEKLGECPAIGAPRFAIHTGNAVGLGLFSELTQFIAAMNELTVPWFNVIGPNDVSFLGSAPNESVRGTNAVVPFVPIGDVDRFMNFHSLRGAKSDLTVPNPEQRRSEPLQNQRGCRLDPRTGACPLDERYPRSLFHGFDANCEKRGAGLTVLETDRGPLCTSARGYYTLTVPSNRSDTTFRIIVLNTAESLVDDGTTRASGGQLQAEQLRWLGRELAALPPGMFALVFGHHPLEEMDESTRTELARLLSAEPRMLGYFHGGGSDSFATHRRAHGVAWPDFGAGPLLDFPQVARAVEVLRAPEDGRLYVRVASFNQGQTKGPLPDPTPPPAVIDGGCAVLAKNTSFCRRLGYRAANGFTAASQLVGDAGAEARANSELNANGLIVAWQPEGGTP